MKALKIIGKILTSRQLAGFYSGWIVMDVAKYSGGLAIAVLIACVLCLLAGIFNASE